MSKKSIEDLRAVLFQTLDEVRNGSLDIERAKTVNEVAKTIVDTAKVEVDYLRTTGGGESSFIETAIGTDNLPTGITAITRHRLQG